MRRFDPADQRTTGTAEAFTLMPASEALLDEDSVKRFRSRYREEFGGTATGDPLYQAVSEGRRLAGMEHWLPLFEEKLATLFDHLGEHDVIVRDSGVDGALGGAAPRPSRTISPTANGQWSPNRAATARSSPSALYLSREEWRSALADRPNPSDLDLPRAGKRPRSSTSESTRPATSHPSVRRQANIYDEVIKHAAKLRKNDHKVVLASYSAGARERLAGLLEDHGLKALKQVRHLAGSAGQQGAKRR